LIDNNFKKDNPAKNSFDITHDNNSNNFIIFGNDDEDMINKWIRIINYLVYK